MCQITSLKNLYFYSSTTVNIPNVIFTSYPGAKECLINLTELDCSSYIYPEFFYQISQICQHLKLLSIIFGSIISDGITELISVQKNLKYLKIMEHYDCNKDLKDIIPSLEKLPN